MEAPATPTMDFRGMDDSATFELFDGSSAIQNRKRRRSSLRRVSFAEQPSIHVFARDDDYETPPEGTMSHLSAQSTPTSVSRSPQRRSERLFAARAGRQDENEVDKENVPTSVGSNARQRRRGRRPLALRDTQKEREEEFLKPSNWLDDHENSAFGSCDENTGPVDLRHITIGDQSMAVDDDDNITMDSETFHTRMSQMLVKQPLHRLSEGRETATTTPRHFTDMDLTVWPDKQAQEGERKVLDQPTWHKGDGDLSDMSQRSFGELSILRVLAKNKSSRKESSIHDTEEKTMDGADNWTEDDAQSQGRIPSLQIERSGSLPGVDDTVSMDTSSPISNGDRRKLFVDEGEQNANIRNVHDAGGLDESQLQGNRTSKDTEFYAKRPVITSEKKTSTFDYDDNVSMENTSQSRTGGNDSTMEFDSGTGERYFNRDMRRTTTLKESESTEPECTALESRVHQAAEPNVILGDNDIGFDPSVQSGAGATEDSTVPLRHYERNLKRMSTSAAEKNASVSIMSKTDFKSQFSRSQGHAPSMPAEPVAGQPVGQGLERQESFLQQGILNNESRKSTGSQAFDGSVHEGIKPETLLPAPDEDIASLDISRTWNERAPQHTSVPTKSSDSAKFFLWEDKDQCMDISDVDMTERYQEGITEAMPKLTFVLGGYNCDSPSVEPLNRIFQRKSDIDAEDSPVYGLTAEIDIQKEKSSKKVYGIAQNRAAEEKETFSNRGLVEDTEELQSNIGKIRNVFQNPEDTFSFKGHQKSTRETSVSTSMGQNVVPRPAFPNVQEKVDAIEVSPRNQSAPQSSGQDQDEDATAGFTGQHNWRAEISSDMSTTPLSPMRPKHFQRLVNKAQTVPMQIDTVLSDSPSFQGDITAAIPNVQDLLAADVGTPESGLGWNPRKIVWSAQQSNLQALEDEVVLRQPGIDQMEDETTHSMAEKLCTPRASEEKKHLLEFMSEEATKTLNQVSHSKEVRNSIASKMLLRMMSLQDKSCAQAESSSDAESQQILRRTLHFQPESDSPLQSQSLRGEAEQQISARDPDGTMEVESVKNVEEETDSNESRLESLQQESRRQKLLQEIQVAEERLVALERHSEELRKKAQDRHQAIAKRCKNHICCEMKGMAACSQAHFSKLKKRFQLLNCMQFWDLKTTKTGDEVLHEFKYWALLTHSVFERKENNLEFTVSKSSIDLNEASINQVYRDMNASLAWRWFLSGHEEIVQPQSLVHHVQGVNSKVVILLDLMEEVNHCRKYLVIPHFRLQIGSGLRLNLQFSDSTLLFDFVVSFDVRQVTHMRYNRSYELDCATEVNQKLDCAVQIESAGRCFGKQITEAEIKHCVALVVSGGQLLLRACASISGLILSKKE